MRTTLTLEDDLAHRLTGLAKQTGQSFNAVVNQVIRRGLATYPVSVTPFSYQPHAGNLSTGLDDRRLNEVAWEPEGEQGRR